MQTIVTNIDGYAILSIKEDGSLNTVKCQLEQEQQGESRKMFCRINTANTTDSNLTVLN